MKKIFIVEDEAVIVLTLEATLKKLGYRVVGIAASGNECLASLKKVRPDIILMDIHLEGDMDGIQVAEIIKSKYELPVIFLTAFSNNDFIRRAKTTNPFGYIVKPFQERELYTTIEIALYKHENERKLVESEKKYRELAESIEQVIIEIDINGKIIFLNQNGAEILGLKQEEYVNKSFFDFFPSAKDAHDFLNHLRRKLQGTNKTNSSNELVFSNSVKRLLFFEEYLNPINKENGVPGFRGVLVNVTHKKLKQHLDSLLTSFIPEIRNGKSSVEKIALKICRTLKRLTAAEQVYFNKYDSKNETITTFSSSGKTSVREFGNGLSEYLIRTSASGLFLEGEKISSFHKKEGLSIFGHKAKSWIGIPILRNERIYGVLAFQSTVFEKFFNSTDFEFFSSFGKELSAFFDEIVLDQQIRTSEINYQTILETINEGLVETDVNTRKITYVNDKICKLMECEPGDVIGQDADFFLSATKGQEKLLSKAMRDNKKGMSGKYELMLLTKQGKEKWFIVSAAPVKNAEGKITSSISLWLDITDKKNAEIALQRSEASKNAIIQAVPDSLLIIEKNGKIVDVYQQDDVIALSGNRRIKGENIINFLNTDQRKLMEAGYRKVYKTGEVSLFEIEKKSGDHIKWYEIRMARISNVKALVLIRDISESKLFQSQLKKFYNAIEQSDDMIMITDRKGMIEYVNPMFCRVVGYTREEMHRKTPAIMESGKQGKVFYKEFWDTILAGKSFAGEFISKKKNKELFIEERIVTPLLNEKGKITNYICTGRDITEHKKNERELEAYAKLKYYLEKKEAKIRTLSLIQGQEKERKRIARELHDGLGQILTATKMNLERIISPEMVVEGRIDDFDKVYDLVIETIQEVRRISNDLSPSGLHDFGLHSAVKNMLSRLREINKNICFNLYSTIERMRFKQDVEINLFRIIQESVHNAIKHSQCTSVDIHLEYIDSRLNISVLDNGKGAYPNVAVYSKNKSSVGHGLKNIKERADLIGGEINIVTEKEKGFQILFQIKIRSIKHGTNFIS